MRADKLFQEGWRACGRPVGWGTAVHARRGKGKGGGPFSKSTPTAGSNWRGRRRWDWEQLAEGCPPPGTRQVAVVHDDALALAWMGSPALAMAGAGACGGGCTCPPPRPGSCALLLLPL